MKPVAKLADVLDIEASAALGALPNSTYELIGRSAAAYPDAPALTFFLRANNLAEAEVWSYAEFFGKVTQAANAFQTLGIGKDDVIAIVLPNLPESHFSIWGGETAGTIAVFNPLLEPSTLASLIASVEAKVLVTLAPFPDVNFYERLVPELSACAKIEHVVLVNLTDRVPGPSQGSVRKAQEAEIVRLFDAKGVRANLPAHVGVHDFAEFLNDQPKDRLLSARTISPSDRSSLFCTGGTTGSPKIAVRHQGNEIANADAVARFLGDGIGPGTAFFCGLPLFHVNGVIVTGLVPFSRGAHVVLGTPEGYRGEGVVSGFWDIVERYKINFFSGVPTLYSSLMQIPIGGRDITSLRYGFCGAAPMPVEVFRSFQHATGLKILEGYGLTEASCVSSINPPEGEKRIGSIGLRLPGQEMKAVLVDESGHYHRDCEIDEVGVLIVSGPNVFEGYWFDEHNQGLWVDCGDGRHWLNTGDLARQDAEGYFWLTGRKKELIIRGGHNIDPAVIEEPLHQHPDVLLVAAIGRPDAYSGELPVAYVQLKPGSNTTSEELIEFVRSRIGERAALPKHIRIVPKLPLTPVGKLFKPALKHAEIEDAISEALSKAGVTRRQIVVKEAPPKGVVIGLTLTNRGDETAARRALGTFSYPFSIEISN
jgi:fatty-acyl-CoA synthase